MNDKAWYISCVFLFFSILIPTSVFLFHGDSSRHRMNVITTEPEYRDHIFSMQTLDPNKKDSCMDGLLDNLQSGNLDPQQVQDDLDKCLGLGLNDTGGNNGENNTPVVPQPPS
ncbi:MAG TPA: hypothetical protein VF884_07945, partial [Nitrososphaeraceae archaeon]